MSYDLVMTIEIKKPENEDLRLKIIEDLNIININKEEFIENINFLASKLLGTPISLVTLIESDRQWVKSAIGIELQETPRNISFCTHTILDEKPMVINDALEEERFKNNPLVNGQLNNIRFYAGAQIKVKEVNLGALCLVDTKPREFAEDDERALELLAGFVSDYLESRLQNYELNKMLKEVKSESDEFTSEMAAKMCDKINNKLAVIAGVLEIMSKSKLPSDNESQYLNKSLSKVQGIAEDVKMLSTELTEFELVKK